MIMKNDVFWDVTPCNSRKKRRFEGTYCLLHQGYRTRRFTGIIVSSSPIVVTVMLEKIRYSETSVLTRATLRLKPILGR
jgi:hypothetical protein